MLFKTDLTSKNDTLLSTFTENEVNSKLKKFNDVLLSTLQSHAPIKTIRVHNRLCPYITQSIKDLMTYRDKLHRKFKLSRDNTDWISYRNVSQSVKIALKKQRKNMYAAKCQLIKIMLHRYGKLLIAVFQPKKDQYNAIIRIQN